MRRLWLKMGRRRCQVCKARPGRLVTCLGCGAMVGPGCKRQCLAIDFHDGTGVCRRCYEQDPEPEPPPLPRPPLGPGEWEC